MNAVGRQMQRSGSTGHHQPQYSSDDFLDPSLNNKWLQSAALQDFSIYGNNGGGQGSRLSRNVQRAVNGGGNDGFGDPSTPLTNSRSSSMRKNGDDDHVSSNELSPGLLDIHSFDTELLPEVPGLYNGSSYNHPVHERSFDDFDPYNTSNKLTNGVRGLPENNLLKSFSVDKEKPSNVAKIKVVVRKRPLNKKEIAKKEDDIITIHRKSNSLVVHETKLKVDLTEYVENHEFLFDAVLSEDGSNDEVYAETVQPIVPIIFQRTKATCFAYGQTGSGKTFTMQPLPLMASQDIFRLMNHTYRNQGFQLFVSFFEIYGGKVYDLLNDRKKLCMREDGKQQVCIVGLQEFLVSNVDTIKNLIERGNATRSTGTTGANEESSRSHAILQLAIKKPVDSDNDSRPTRSNGNDSKPARLVGKLSFIDLAGSERGADTTDNDKQTRMEGAEINKSLLALKECIRALDNDQGHIPFRGSKLTEVLRDSFVGDSRTVMISCISPNSGSCEHTLNTLRYADRVKSLSKGNSSKRDPSSSSSNIRSSTAFPLSSVSTTLPASEDKIPDVPFGNNRFGWSKQIERESSASVNIERVPSGRMQNNLVASAYLDHYRGQKGGGSITEDESYRTYEQDKAFLTMNKKAENNPTFASEKAGKPKMQSEEKDLAVIGAENSNADGDLNTLLKEEEDLVTAHRKQVEDTMDIVREEMNLLVQIDQPGNQLDDYISKLNSILSNKAAGILKLQTRLAQFQRHLKEYNVLVSSSGQ